MVTMARTEFQKANPNKGRLMLRYSYIVLYTIERFQFDVTISTSSSSKPPKAQLPLLNTAERNETERLIKT
jgi:hypothetical protein